MKTYYKVIFSASLLLFLGAPEFAHAAWYNPFSWFKKSSTPAIIHAVPARTSTSTAAAAATSASNERREASTPALENKVLPESASDKPKPVPAEKIETKAVSVTAAAASTREDKKAPDVPTFDLAVPYQQSNFTQPKKVRAGTELLSITASSGDSQAIGLWYVDSITWRIVSDDMRSGDMVLGVSSKQNIVSDTNLINEPITTALQAHAVSDELSFRINGSFPSRGRAHLVIDNIKGHMKGDTAMYSFKGTPIVGPEFSF